jgi:hypothetical protein
LPLAMQLVSAGLGRLKWCTLSTVNDSCSTGITRGFLIGGHRFWLNRTG